MVSVDRLIRRGQALGERGDSSGALALFRQAIEAFPDHPDGYLNLADMLLVMGFDTEARATYDIALARIPHSVPLLWGRCMASLPAVYTAEAEIDASRADFTYRLRKLRAACYTAPGSFAANVPAVGLKSPFFLPYQGHNDKDLLAEHGRLITDIMAAGFPSHAQPHRVRWTQGSRIRVGFVSGMFWRHSVWRLPMRGWVEHMDRSRFELFGYHTRPERDDQTAHAASVFDHFEQGSADLPTWITAITRDAPQVLIYPELAADQTSVQLGSLRLAPVQCTSWGQPVTTGMPTIDHYLSSDLMEPEDAQDHYTENLVRLPGLGAVYRPAYAGWGDRLPAADSWAGLDLPDNAVRYLCCQAQQKYLPRHDDLYPHIAARVPRARFLFVEQRQRAAEIMRYRLTAAFERHGLSMPEYCRFVPVLTHAAFSAATRDAHVFLDTPEWSGCNTALEALLHEVPIVTLPGTMMRGRHGLAILQKASATRTIAKSLDDYVRIAVRLGQDAKWRQSVAASYARGQAKVFDDLAPVRALEDFLTDAVTRTIRT